MAEGILAKFCERVGYDPMRKRLDFDGDPYSLVNSGSLRIVYHWEIGLKLRLCCVRQVAAPYLMEVWVSDL